MRRDIEIWKEYPLNFEYEGDYRIEVSNLGRVKTFNKLYPEGNIINGTMQGGFPIIRIKLFKERTPADKKKIEDLQIQIDALTEKVKFMRLSLSEEYKEERLRLAAERDELIQKRKKLNIKINNKRCINLAILKHKAVAELFLPKPEREEQKFIIHKDFDKENNKVDNLEWASQEELNVRYMQHPKNVMYAHRKKTGEVSVKPSSKLNATQVLTIRKRLARGYTLRRLAKQFGVSDMQIHRIKTGENWSSIKSVEELKEEKEKRQAT